MGESSRGENFFKSSLSRKNNSETYPKQKTAYQTNKDGYYVGQTRCHNNRIPAGAIETAPPKDKDGFVQKWNEKAWEYVPNHIGEKGYLHNLPHEIKEYGDYPEGWTTEYIKSEAEILQDQINQIKYKLTDIDRQTTRPLRAKIRRTTDQRP